MNLEQNLRQLHKIEPDPAYARDSRARLILAHSRMPRFTFQAFAAGVLRSGFAMATLGLLLFFAIGGSIWNLVFSPVTGWDSKTLRAEAEAIETRIHLADLQYNDPGYERQRLISSDTDLNSIAIVTGSEDPDLAISVEGDGAAEGNASSTAPIATDNSGDTENASSTIAASGDPNATSTPVMEEDDGVIDAEEALDILSH